MSNKSVQNLDSLDRSVFDGGSRAGQRSSSNGDGSGGSSSGRSRRSFTSSRLGSGRFNWIRSVVNFFGILGIAENLSLKRKSCIIRFVLCL